MIPSVPRGMVVGSVVALTLGGFLGAVTSCASSEDQSSSPTTVVEIDLAELGSDLKADPPTEVNPPDEEKGLPPVVRSIKTNDKVVFLTIDDGATADPKITETLRKTGIPVTPFLTENVTVSKKGYFTQISELTGQKVQNHTIDHPHLSGLSQAKQRKQICQTNDDYQNWFGAEPWMFRPPYGEFTDTTREAAKECGIDYLVNWNVSLPAAHLRYSVGDKLLPGDIILTHWRPDLHKHLLGAIKDIKQQGFKVAALQDYLPQR